MSATQAAAIAAPAPAAPAAPAAAPAAAPTTAPSTGGAGEAARIAAAAAAVSDIFGPAPADAPAPAAGDGSAPPAPAEGAGEPGKTPETPAPAEEPGKGKEKPAETPPADGSQGARVAELLLEQRSLTTERDGLRTNLRTVTSERDADRRELEALKAKLKDPFESMAAGGHDFEQVVLDLKSGKLKLPERKARAPELPPEVAEELRLSREYRERTEREQRETAQAAQRTQEIDVIKQTITELAADLPYIQGLAWVPERVYDRFYAAAEKNGVFGKDGTIDRTKLPKLDQVIREVDAAVRADAQVIYSSEAALKALASDPKMREVLLKVARELGGQQSDPPPPASSDKGPKQRADGPPALSSVAQSIVPPRTTPGDEQERLRAAALAVDDVFRR